MSAYKYSVMYDNLVLKRDGKRTEPYDQGKIEDTLRSLFRTSNDVPKEDVDKVIISIANTVTLEISESYPKDQNKPVSTEVIQETLEKMLMHFGLHKTLKMYIIFGYTKLLLNNPPK